MTAMNSNAATGQWNQILCRPVNALITTRNTAMASIGAKSRGWLESQCETIPIHVDGPALSRMPEAPARAGLTRAVKAAFDGRHILNPGRMFEDC